ncbi:UPF0702 transmembrane protein [Fibrella aestuarina BUZ 2]|uniref:UPF0702 transmembrane protein n=1 Tax=Fibrella aestuarina BUZ 2 TaxID=1166018 RepID=I0K702_9BACT|nr:YetF domain-containing protein [Fibrella aestuarina]CCG99905.1 UPF0702 transmembrane protein [Fibrella aestuarina BUZ 2]
MKDPIVPFDLERMFIDQFPITYLGEVALRTLIMFVILLAALTVSGKREVRQLSVYELVLLIGLGSAAGDPMFYHDVPLGASIVVFVVMMSAYKFITRLSDRNKAIRERIEGKPVYVIQDGCILTQNFDDEDLGQDELFVDLRQAGLEHLGQVRLAILEPNGSLSVYPYPDDEVRPGLPVLPHLLKEQNRLVETTGTYACSHCGHTQIRHPGTNQSVPCPVCNHEQWVKTIGPVGAYTAK